MLRNTEGARMLPTLHNRCTFAPDSRSGAFLFYAKILSQGA
jgi:hypothetical protein